MMRRALVVLLTVLWLLPAVASDPQWTLLIVSRATSGEPIRLEHPATLADREGGSAASLELIKAAREVAGVGSTATFVVGPDQIPPPSTSGRRQLLLVSGVPLEPALKLGYAPVLMGSVAGCTSAQWVLLAREGAVPAAMTTGRLASRAIKHEVKQALEESLLKPVGLTPSGLRMVEVGKGIDALLALKSAQVELALVERTDLHIARRVTPTTLAGLAELRSTPELPMAVLLVAREQVADPQVARVVSTLITRQPSGLERWVPPPGP